MNIQILIYLEMLKTIWRLPQEFNGNISDPQPMQPFQGESMNQKTSHMDAYGNP